jgi:hypothetical protein
MGVQSAMPDRLEMNDQITGHLKLLQECVRMTISTESIVRLERSVWQAVMENDGAALAELFSDEYVEITLEGKRVLKTDVVIESPQVDHIRSYSIAEERVIPLGPTSRVVT